MEAGILERHRACPGLPNCIHCLKEHLRSTAGLLEKIADDKMPSCFTPTRESFVALARIAIELRGGTRN